ncbi:MAG TPA: hypothetical protein ENN64_00360 [bacterium]|nr:hypothetical protein [bacterium]
MKKTEYKDSVKELIIIGSGPAGLSAAIYSSRYKINHLVIGAQFGGLISTAHKVCNYPGFPEIDGFELGKKMYDHALLEGSSIINETVKSVSFGDNLFEVITESGNRYHSYFLLFAAGTERRKLALDGEDKYLGKGVTYCATCDAMFYKGKVVGVVGGSNAATTAALYLSEVSSKVYMFVRGSRLLGERVWIDNVLSNSNIEVIYKVNVAELLGDKLLGGVILDNGDEISLHGLFIEIGSVPNTELLKSFKLDYDKNGYVKVDSKQESSQKRLFLAGDITTASNKFNQVVTAVAEGAIAANSIYEDLVIFKGKKD